MTYVEWEAQVPEQIKNDPLWRVEVYRLSLFLSDLAWPDATRLLRDGRTRSIADQLNRSAGNISSNITEGYSRSSGLDRARFYEYALGSVREVRDWYYKARRLLSPKVGVHRIDLASQVVGLLVTMIRNEKERPRLKERDSG